MIKLILPLGANVPSEWINRKLSTVDYQVIVVLSWGTGSKDKYNIKMWFDDRRLECECEGFIFRHYCHHIRGLIWFTYKPARTKGVQDTSLLAYRGFSEDDLSKREMAVYTWLKENGPASNREIAEGMRWPINCVTGRVNSLRNNHAVVADAGKALDTVTQQMVHIWVVVGELVSV